MNKDKGGLSLIIVLEGPQCLEGRVISVAGKIRGMVFYKWMRIT